jgi:hypothetical protein
LLGGFDVKLRNDVHRSRPWRIHEIVEDFHLEDVWALPTPGGPDDFPLLVHGAVSLDPAQSSSAIVRALFAIRWKLGELFGWDDERSGVGARVPSLRDRLPADLRDTAFGPEFESTPFSPLYLTDGEFAAEVANKTVHGVVHFGWVPDEAEGYRGEMAIYVKRNGLLGAAYMAAITPFRYLFVYPPLMREIGRTWRAGKAAQRVARAPG